MSAFYDDVGSVETNMANLVRYEALGFASTGEFGLDGGPVIMTMWREARATRDA